MCVLPEPARDPSDRHQDVDSRLICVFAGGGGGSRPPERAAGRQV